MSSFSIVYSGQFRFFECSYLHKNIIEGNDGIYASMTPFVRELWGIDLQARTSVYKNKSLKESIKEFRQHIQLKHFYLSNKKDFDKIANSRSLEFFPCQYFFTFANQLPDIDTDYSIFITTDLIFNSKEKIFQNMVNSYEKTVLPTAYVNIFEKNLITTFVICLNREALRLVRNNWLTAIREYLTEDNESRYRNEYATMRLLQLCGIRTFRPLHLKCNPIRFRANMDINNLDYEKIKEMSLNYSEYKKLKVKEKWG